MNTLLGKEKILYDAVTSKTIDRDYLVAFQDYIGFLAEQGTDLLLHMGDQLVERNKKSEALDVYRDGLVKEVILIRDQMTEIADKLGIREDTVISSDLNDLNSLIDGSTTVFGGSKLDSIQSEIFGLVNRLLQLEHYNEANLFLDTKIQSANDLRDKNISITKKIKEFLAAEDIFVRQDASTLAGALIRLLDWYKEMIYYSNVSTKFEATPENFMQKLFEDRKNKEYSKLMSHMISDGDYFTRGRYQPSLERIHNSIVMNNTEKAEQKVITGIFYLEHGNIYHHSKSEKLKYKLRGENDPMYIKLFKNILKHMPPNQEKISIKKFKLLLPVEDRNDDKYRANLSKSAKSFNNFLRNNDIDNLRPDTKEMVLEATDDYITFRNNL